MSMVEKIKV